MVDPILTAALPLRNFLDVCTFHCSIPEYQRLYQWEAKLHTQNLLEDLKYAYEHAQPHMLLGNIILQQTDAGQGLNRSKAQFWWQERSRHCDIVDGQQRTTTLVMLYGAIQEHLRLTNTLDCHEEIILSLNTRLSGELGGGANKGYAFLQTQQEDFAECFNFKVKGSLTSDLQELSIRRRERKNAEFILEWLQKTAERAADKKSTAPGHDVGGFLEYLDKSVYLTLTVTANPQLAFQSFANINYSGHPLGNEDILKAILVQRIPGKDEKVARQKHMREWKSVAKKLHSRQNLNSDSNATKAWHHRNGVMLKVASRGAIELPASLMDELFEHMRRLNDPDRLCQMDMLDFYRLQFQLRGDGRCLPELGFNVIPSLFVGEYLKPFGKALLTLVSNEDEQLTGQQDGSASGQHHANIKWCRQAIFNLLCFPNQEWRTAAVLAISMAQASKHSAAWLRSFLQELECLTLGAILLPCTYTQQKKAFTQLVKNLQQVDVILPPAEVYAQVFRGVWLSTEGFGGKQKLLQAVKGRDLYKNGNNKHAKAVLLAVEHQLATGDRLTAGAGGYSRRWEGTLSVEHIMPQDPATDSDWFKEEGPGWTAALAKPWLHKLGNLCVLSVSQNSSVSNSSFSNKKRLLFDEPMRQGLAAGLSAFSLDKVDVWNLAALKSRHAFLVQCLADRWGWGKEWRAMHGSEGHNDGQSSPGEASQASIDAGSLASTPTPQPKAGDRRPARAAARPQPKQKKRKPAGNLVLQAADKEKESFTLLPNQIYKVGRSEEFNDIVIPNDSVSGVHARIEPGKNGVLLIQFM
ncbi:MAG: hypothetical protein FRX49_00155 [Trebouxia sp. A1-2]|nr:MAG: hypothetical protein FRX49_00155 [Trebouxia sp. A1-2]